MHPRMPQIPSWVMPGAKYDFDFANNRYWNGNVWLGIGDGSNKNSYASTLVCGDSGANAFTLFAPDTDGNCRSFPQYGLRRTRYGLWVEGNSTNWNLYCRDFTQTNWVKSSMTASLNQTGVNTGANQASSLTASANNATALQSITLTSRQLVVSAYIKRLSGTGTVSLTVDNGATYTDISGSINSSSYTLVSIAAQTLANPTVGVKLGTSGDSIAIDCFQTEDNAFPTSPMITTGATNVRGPEAGYWNTTASIYNDGQRLLNDINNSAAPVTVLAQFSTQNTGAFIFGDDLQGVFVKLSGGALVVENKTSQTSTTANTASTSLYTLNKACARYNGFANGLSACLNGGAIAVGAGSFSPVQAISHGGLGNVGAGTAPMNGYISRLTLWNKELTDGQLIAYTT